MGSKKKSSIASRCARKASNPAKVKARTSSKPRGRQSVREGTREGHRKSGTREPQRDARFMAPKSEILRQAANAVSRMIQADATGKHGVSLKSLTLGGNVQARQKKAVYAVTVETLKYYTVLEALVRGVGGLGPLSVPTACVLVKEVVLGSGFSNQWVGPAERLVLEKEAALRGVLERLKEERGVGDVSELLPHNALMAAAKTRRRTVRVNAPLGAGSVEEVMGVLEGEFVARGVVRNAYVEDVIELEAGVDLHAHRLVENGWVVLQSLASCMPASALDPEAGWTVIDACAAPGNKTTHLASLMARKMKMKMKMEDGSGARAEAGKIFAFDRDPKRLGRLEANVALTNSGSIITARCADFLTIDPQSDEYNAVDAVLLDPSCSGSGTSVSRMDYLLPSAQIMAGRGTDYTDDRVEQLSRFQLSAIMHAMSFPRVKRLVYSTCSVYCEENERVVARALEEGRKLGFELVPCIPSWPRRGVAERGSTDSLSRDDAEKVLRIDPLADGTDGFFVALWRRG